MRDLTSRTPTARHPHASASTRGTSRISSTPTYGRRYAEPRLGEKGSVTCWIGRISASRVVRRWPGSMGWAHVCSNLPCFSHTNCLCAATLAASLPPMRITGERQQGRRPLAGVALQQQRRRPPGLRASRSADPLRLGAAVHDLRPRPQLGRRRTAGGDAPRDAQARGAEACGGADRTRLDHASHRPCAPAARLECHESMRQ